MRTVARNSIPERYTGSCVCSSVTGREGIFGKNHAKRVAEIGDITLYRVGLQPV
jgi:hypothetical protein